MIGVSTALVALLIFGVVSEGGDDSIDQALADGTRPLAPDVPLTTLGEDGEGSLSDYRGQIVVLNFWASWCPPCVEELPLLEGAQQGIESSGATVVGVNYKDIPEDALGFVDEYGISYPSLRDPDGEYADEFGTSGIPETFVIDREGRVAAARRGPIDQKWIDETLPPLLAEES